MRRHCLRDERLYPLPPPTSARRYASPDRVESGRLEHGALGCDGVRGIDPDAAVEREPADDRRRRRRRRDADRRPRTWSGTPPISYAYQWRRCNSTGASCVDVAGATAATLTLAPTDVGSTFRIVVTASNGIGSSTYRSAVLADSPRSYWRFDDGSGPLVDQQGVANGSYVNNPTRNVEGLLAGDVDTAALLDGTSQYLDVPANAAWTQSPFSIEIIVEPSSLPVNKTVWSTMGAGFTGWWLNTGPSGQVRMFVGDGGAWQRGPDGPVLAAGVRHDLVATYDGTYARLYVDGALVSTSAAIAMNGAVGSSPMRFGAYSTGPGQYWAGTVDEASFYPAVLTASQVAAHADASSTAPTGVSATSAATAVVAAAAPANGSPPSVAGTAQVGQTLTASSGSWTGTAPIAYAYQWQRCGGSCSDIAGATATTYTLAGADQAQTVQVVVTASNSAGSATATSTPVGPVTAASGGTVTVSFAAAGADDGDVNVSSPLASGYPPTGTAAANTAGSVFTAGKRNAFGNYQLLTALIRFDTSSLPDDAQIQSASLRLTVTGKKNGDGRNLIGSWYPNTNWPIDGADATDDAGTTAIAGSPLATIATGQLDLTLANPAQISTTTPTGLRLGISGGAPTADNYLQLAAADNTGKPAPQLTVTYTTGSSGTPPANGSPPSVAGTAQVGQTLTASSGSWTGTAPIAYTYQWQRCGGSCSDIAGATATTYTLAGADQAQTVQVVVTASNSAGSATATSTPVGPVTAASGGTVTVSFAAAGADDGDVNVSSPLASGYPPTGTAAANTAGSVFTAGKRNAFGNYQLLTALIRFDTSSLPDDAQIQSASLRLTVTGKKNGDGRNLIGSWYPNTNWPIDGADATDDAGTTAIAGSPLATIATGQLDLTLANPAQISTTTPTGLRLGISGGAPTADNYLQLAAADNTGKPAPQLTVTYAQPGAG